MFKVRKGARLMKTRFFSGVLGSVISASLLFTAPAFAYDSHDRGGHGDHNSSYSGYDDRDYHSGGHVDRIIPTVAMGAMSTVSSLTMDTIPIRVTGIPLERSDIGEKTRGIIAVATSIITNARMGESL